MYNQNYFGYGNQYPQQFQQPVNFQSATQSANTAPNVSPNQNVNWIRVSGIEEVKSHIVMPNQTVWFLDNNESVFYVKSADNLGTTTLKAYQYSEITRKIDSKTFSGSVDINPSDYVKKCDIDDLIANKFSQLMNEYTSSTKTVENENKKPKGGKNE